VLLLTYRLKESASPEGRRLDVPGQATAVIALGGLAFAVIEGPHLGWASAPVLASASLAGLGLPALIVVERRTPGGLVPFELFGRRPFSAALMVAGLMTFGMYALLFLMPLYFQTLRGDGALMAGVRLLPLSVAFVLVSQCNGAILQAIGTRATMAWGMTAMGIGELLSACVSAATSHWLVAGALCLVGVGLGLNTAAVNSAAVSNAPRQRSGTASGLLNTARMVGATLGVAILGAVFARYADEATGADGFLAGLRAALVIGGVAELAGAVVALRFIRD
jgi:MFS family permease